MPCDGADVFTARKPTVAAGLGSGTSVRMFSSGW
jgi:hypothetical protein